MYRVSFKPSFIRQARRLEKSLLEEVFKKIEFLKHRERHVSLKVHKLHGPLADCYSFSVNYQTRILFKFESKREVVLLAIGEHDIYKR